MTTDFDPRSPVALDALQALCGADIANPTDSACESHSYGTPKHKDRVSHDVFNGYWVWWCVEHNQPTFKCDFERLKRGTLTLIARARHALELEASVKELERDAADARDMLNVLGAPPDETDCIPCRIASMFNKAERERDDFARRCMVRAQEETFLNNAYSPNAILAAVRAEMREAAPFEEVRTALIGNKEKP